MIRSRPSAFPGGFNHVALGVAVVALAVYAALVGVGPLESARSVGGIAALFGPMAVLLFRTLRREISDAPSNVVFSAIGSYAFTTALYFGCCAVWSPGLFYFFYAAMFVAAVVLAVAGVRRPSRRPDVNWTLAAVVALTLVAFSRYQRPYQVDPQSGDVHIVASADQTYFCAQAYELARHTPPVQQACQAGVPERAYHLFPHVAAMLIARFTGQTDMMRAHLLYHYGTLTVLGSLALYVIASRLTGSRAAGYLAAACLVIFAIPLPTLTSVSPAYFGFTPFPLATSSTEPVFITSPQMFDGVVITFGVMVGVVLMCDRLCAGQRCTALTTFCGLMVASMVRFRVQTFIPLMPGFTGVLAYAWWRSPTTRARWGIASAGMTTGIVAGLLYLETRWPGYLAGTAGLRLGFQPSVSEVMNCWPFASDVRRAFGGGGGRGWKVTSIVLFTALNVVGIPQLVAASFWFGRRENWRRWAAYSGLMAWLAVGSVAGAMFFNSAYDPYSVGQQMLFQTGWYLLPLLPVAAWGMVGRVRARQAWAYAAALFVLAATATQVVRPPSALEGFTRYCGVVLTRNERLALDYLRTQTPADAVVIANGRFEDDVNWAVIPGLTGRASYLTYIRGTLGVLPHNDDGRTRAAPARSEVCSRIWAAASTEELGEALREVHADYLVEFSTRPLSAPPPPALREVWTSPAAGPVRVRIFRLQTGHRNPAPSAYHESNENRMDSPAP